MRLKLSIIRDRLEWRWLEKRSEKNIRDDDPLVCNNFSRLHIKNI